MDCSLPGSPCPWDSPGENTGVGCHFLLQVFFPTQELNPCILHCRQILYQLSYEGDPWNGDIWSGFLLVGNELAARMVGLQLL